MFGFGSFWIFQNCYADLFPEIIRKLTRWWYVKKSSTMRVQYRRGRGVLPQNHLYYPKDSLRAVIIYVVNLNNIPVILKQVLFLDAFVKRQLFQSANDDGFRWTRGQPLGRAILRIIFSPMEITSDTISRFIKSFRRRLEARNRMIKSRAAHSFATDFRISSCSDSRLFDWDDNGLLLSFWRLLDSDSSSSLLYRRRLVRSLEPCRCCCFSCGWEFIASLHSCFGLRFSITVLLVGSCQPPKTMELLLWQRDK